MFLLDDVPAPGLREVRGLVWSPSDLVAAARCELGVVRRIDEVLGRAERVPAPADEMLVRASRLGDAHEQRVLDGWVARLGAASDDDVAGRVVSVPPLRRVGYLDLVAAHGATLAALEAGAGVVHQATFFDGEMHGRADFLVREGDGGRYAVLDAKLARRAKVEALLQVAAYADQLVAAHVPLAPSAGLVLGSGERTAHRLADLLPVFRERRARLRAIVAERLAASEPVAWGDPRYHACGRCERCVPEVEAHDDVLLVAGVRRAQRDVLLASGVRTVAALAAAQEPPAAMSPTTFAKLRRQAAMQSGTAEVDGTVTWEEVVEGRPVARERSWTVVDTAPIDALPPASDGDLFFDFEGDPLWTDASASRWGIDYLFGVTERPAPGERAPFLAFWAHDLAQERAALVAFVDHVAERRRRYPDLHVYHYAPYEKTHLVSIAARHGVYEQEVDDLLRAGVLVDLYAVVRASVRISAGSYSIKKLEPLYMAEHLRAGDVTDAAASIVAYAAYCDLRDAGEADAAEELLGQIRDYNRYDCDSTLVLLAWLRWAADRSRARAAGARGAGSGSWSPGSSSDVFHPASFLGLPPGPSTTSDDDPGDGRDGTTVSSTATLDGVAGDGAGTASGVGPDPAREDPRAEAHAVEAQVREIVGEDRAARDAQTQALALIGAGVGYYEREDKPFWQEHFSRLADPVEDWTGRRSSFVVDAATELEGWAVQPGRQTPSRLLELRGRLEEGSDLRAGAKTWAVYECPGPGCAKSSENGSRVWTEGIEVVEVSRDAETDVLVVAERAPRRAEPWSELPMALAPAKGPYTAPQQEAVLETARRCLASWRAEPGPRGERLPRSAVVDLVLRRPPRCVGDTAGPAGTLPPVGEGPDRYVEAITAAVRGLDRSCLAVQGPPGTGKTHVASHVIARLVADGWRIGVVAQSHAAVENLVRAVVEKAGVPGAVVAKKLENGAKPSGEPWQQVDGKGLAVAAAAAPCVVGGTAWDFANAKNFPDEHLDLLVVDEAGQFSLANTIAVGRAARRLLLLGDPQQLDQVTQGRHPEPVDRSALAHLAGEHGVLPAEHGYFLSTTWRMHPALAGAVSELAYEGRLAAEPVTRERRLDGILPGLRTVRVPHVGNATSSPEEAAEVVALVRDVLGRGWTASSGSDPAPLDEAGVIVVAAYNAQVWTVRRALERAGLGAVRVGTVDKFQGQEAPVAILTTAASSVEDVPRGLGFLLSRNRVNVAVSRGQWCAVVVRSTRLTDHLPGTPEDLEQLGAFVGLCERGD
ncbi:bifunctional RecB family nuclease/DEAD/DEAH box helicase [Cellulomonas sp. PhB143]|uniref:TM0106 family RecB-like putative nuclease n=1 Tax=Cellulomonas sp. PhB143 TaxID=2485186 RepID=UPI000F4ACF38|nr:bifunctional RecB family nuclease/DEAD/DEAH box helicase [Cellulomonas sp. PhB143]ROS73392.1 uncharacterized protein EDF32_2660 [Cellulomonas sp. PhB143]